MANTTPEKVKAIAKHLKKLAPEVLEMYISDAQLELGRYRVAEKYEERLQRYLSAHLATLDSRRPDNYSVGEISAGFSSGVKGLGLDSTEYGQEFKRQLRKAMGFMVKIL